jgi:hypothetical protein
MKIKLRQSTTVRHRKKSLKTKNELLWDKFEKTGAIEAYIRYARETYKIQKK